ncbi:MAG: hypothetical protein AAFZ15_16685 [Bacteroidota bacterium]
MKYFFLSLGFCAFVLSLANGQTYKQYIKAADEEFGMKDYYSAMIHYQTAMEIEGESQEILFKYAESARLFEAYSIADSVYTKVVSADSTGSYALALYWLGSVNKKIGNYLASQQYYQLFADQFASKYANYAEKARREVEDLNWAIEAITILQEDVIVDSVENQVNTNVSEFAPVLVGDYLYYSTQNDFRVVEKGKDPQPFSIVMRARKDGSNAERVVFNDEKRHTAHSVFTEKGDRVYYTLCDYVGESTEVQCQIHYRNIAKSGEFGEPVRLPNYINQAGFTATDPSLGKDNSTGKILLFFVSDRSGGVGGFDIWCSTLENDSTFSRPVNVTELNTPGDEATPMFHNQSQTLYFSSNGRQGFGGHDIYKTLRNDGEWEEIEHLLPPYNSSYDDTHFWIDQARLNGFFSSKRLGSKYVVPELEACCFDIYKFAVQVIDLDVLTFNKKNSEPLEGVKIELFELTQTGELKLADKTNNDGNDFNFELKRNTEYVLLATRNGFLPIRDTIDMRLPDNQQSRSIERKLYLVPETVDLDVFSFNKKTMNKLKGVEVRLVIDGQEVDFKKNDDSNDVSFVLERGKNYQLIGSKVAYFSDTVNIDLRTDVTTLKLEEDLLLQPKEIEDFPPLVIYFDNDHPNPSTRKTTTEFSYKETWAEYMAKKDLYVKEYVKSLTGFDSLTSTRRMGAFFEREVNNGYLSLEVFTENILEIMEDGGFKVELVIQGFTSPRASADYNYSLSLRRSSCLKNHFETWRNGILKPFVKDGRITLEVVGYGEELAPQFISDRLDDERESIYSVQASFERKVAIIGARRVAEN